ncbi:MAG: SusC/RagA family TonB-linked outer membrane protein [Mangrovibacterium sp.]
MKRIALLLAILAFGLSAVAQTKTITGTVTSDDGSSLPGVTVLVKGTTVGTVTNTDGKYSLKTPTNAKTLVFSFIGMQTQELPINGSQINVSLIADAIGIDEVVAVGYGVTTREAITGAVAEVDAKAIESRPVSSVAGALEGSTPGVQVNNTYGQPGTDPKIRIRGFASVNGSNDPLYVVDGVPYTGNISDLNPNDVESMTVLKDAASAALYGNRAANGVIVITTKQGKKGKLSVNVSANMGAYNRGIDEFERLSPDEWMETMWTGYRNSLISSGQITNVNDASAYASNNLVSQVVFRNIYNTGDTELFDSNGKLNDGVSVLPGYSDLDWRDGIERTGFRQEYNINANAASDRYKVYASLGYLDEAGYIINSDFERVTARVNSSFTPVDWFETGVNLSVTSSQSDQAASASGTAYANPFYQTRMMAPIYPMYMHNADGSYALDENGKKQYDLTSQYLDNRHLIYETENNSTTDSRDILKGQAYAKFNFLKDFSFTVRGDKSFRNRSRKKFDNPNVGDGQGGNGRLYSYYYRWDESTFQQQLNWNKSYNNHNVDVLLGHENYSYDRSYNYTGKDNMVVDGILENSNFTNQVTSEGYSDEYRTESYLGRIRYNYDGKYYADASFRRDGSSRFYKDNRWGNFYSFGASWSIDKEDFMDDVNWVDYTKLRASYGEVGNDQGVGFYGYQSLYDIEQNGNSGAFFMSQLGNKDIQWETTATFDIALEGRLFNRMNYSINYFDKASKDLLFDVLVPSSNGAVESDVNGTYITQNIGKVSNYGVELAFDVDAIRTKDWNWNIGFDATFLKNKVRELPNGDDIINGTQKISEGRSLYEFWTYQFQGVDQMTGDALYTVDTEAYNISDIDSKWIREINGEYYTTNTTYGYRDFSGSAIPDVYGSINSSLSYKGFSLNMLFTYSIGGKMYDSSYRSLMNVSQSPSAIHVDALNSWNGTPEGITETSENRIDPNGLPRIDYYSAQYNNDMSDRFLLDASYFVIKNITLSYQFPRHLLKPLNLQGLTLKGSIENLATFTSKQGINPQYGFSGKSDYTFTTPRVFTFGVDINL